MSRASNARRGEARARGGRVELEADQHAEPAHRDEAAAPGERAEPLRERRARASRARAARSSRTSTSSAARPAAHESGWPPNVVTCASGGSWRERRHDLGPADERAERQPAAERLREHEQVRDDAPVLEPEEAAGAAERGHDLVEDEQRAGLVAAAPERRQEPRRGMRTPPSACTGSTTTAATRSSIGASARLVVERQQADVGQQRLERRAVDRIAADRERAPRVAVEAAVERDEAPGGRCACAPS